MALTLSKVNDFIKELEYILDESRDLVATRQRDALFTSANDKELEFLVAARRYPSQYFYFRDFDVSLELRTDRSNNYYLVGQGTCDWNVIYSELKNVGDKRFLLVDTKKRLDSYLQKTEDKEEFILDNIKQDCFIEAREKFNRCVCQYLLWKLNVNGLFSPLSL